MDRSEDSDEETWRRMDTQVSLRWLANRAIVQIRQPRDQPAAGGGRAPGGRRGARCDRCDRQHRGPRHRGRARPGGSAGRTSSPPPISRRTLRELAAHRVASPESCQEILATLAAQQINDAIPTGSPTRHQGRPQVRLGHRDLARRRHRLPGRLPAVRPRGVYDVGARRRTSRWPSSPEPRPPPGRTGRRSRDDHRGTHASVDGRAPHAVRDRTAQHDPSRDPRGRARRR